MKLIALIICIIAAIGAIALAFGGGGFNLGASPLYVLLFCLIFFIFQLFNALKEKENSPKDSEILVNELKKRVEAVNLWDK